MRSLWAAGLLLAPALASPLHTRQSLPTVKLPYGTWQAFKYDAASDVYVFKNIRFAAPPVGDLRFSKPAPPANNETLQTGEYGPACPQIVPATLLPAGLPPLPPGVDIGLITSGANQTGEDCLFLDVYVPGKALSGNVKLPVVNWIYGGAFLLGAKDGGFDGTPLIQAAGGNIIYIAGNYRLNSLGFLAGTTMEDNATPNAGLWDQYAVLQWIQQYSPLFGGDPDNVNLWGESAGAGSIMHQLTAFGGQKKAMFKRAVIQSSAFDTQIDRRGQLEYQFRDMAWFAGCGGKNGESGESLLKCLRGVDLGLLKNATTAYIGSLPGGKPGLGPAADGNFVRQIPSLEIASGNTIKGVETIINSHVFDEAQIFLPAVINETVYQAVINHYWGTYGPSVSAINDEYVLFKYNNSQSARLKAFYQFSVFTCNSRFISNGFETYNLQYSRGSGLHGSDIQADFYNQNAPSGIPGIPNQGPPDPTFGAFATSFQSYLVSHARTGDPNTYRDGGTIQWPLVKKGPVFGNVLNAGNDGFTLIDDDKNKAIDCDFWLKLSAKMTDKLGLAPEGEEVDF